jgi:hypothetical protein
MAGFARVFRHSRTLVVIPGHDLESRKSWIPDQVGDDEQRNPNRNGKERRYELNSNKPNKYVV